MIAWYLVATVVFGQANDAAEKPREVVAIRREVSELLQAESSAADNAERSRHVRQMTVVYREIVADDRFVTHPVLQQQRIKLWTRLTRVRDELKRLQSIKQRTPSVEQEREQTETASAVAAHLQFASQSLGGSTALFAEAPGGGAIDWGDDLVDLIQSTINPSHWNVNGGPGSIVFYRPALALVVRTTSEVHSHVGELIGGVRK